MEFTVDPVSTFANMNNRQSAIRIKHLPAGSVQFETLLERGVRGVVAKEAPCYPSSASPTRVPVSNIFFLLFKCTFFILFSGIFEAAVAFWEQL